ncbi:hypothetical protein NEUTE2DRAFT_132769 [Neurospora tetrasperma FGSC 2509]|nr:hypothetical protein NEUTE2DRAFT_132769 [Neurospora tetrasperma FGSC 2509]
MASTAYTVSGSLAPHEARQAHYGPHFNQVRTVRSPVAVKLFQGSALGTVGWRDWQAMATFLWGLRRVVRIVIGEPDRPWKQCSRFRALKNIHSCPVVDP